MPQVSLNLPMGSEALQKAKIEMGKLGFFGLERVAEVAAIPKRFC